VSETAATPEAVVRHLVAGLAEDGLVPLDGVGQIVAKLLLRESLAPTGLGHGAAVPRGMTTAVLAPTGVVGHVPHGVRWGSTDSELVTAVCLILCPASGEGLALYVRMLEGAIREFASGR
jgi:mannitol/fructose-specific phosphotransferase system IIA component (Ntr-type)